MTHPDFDEIIDRIGTHCSKWDQMKAAYGVDPEQGGLPMWVADMDFRPPTCVQAVVERMAAHGIYGYYGDDTDYKAAIRWWMTNRHGWDVAPEAIFTTHGLVNGTGLVVQAFTAPGDGVLLMTPVYHAFARTIRAAGRRVVECPLRIEDGLYRMDLSAWEAQARDARMMILCSPHNPGGRVWTPEELRALADFCVRHDLILVSDEIHHDLVFPGARHTPMPLAAPDIADRLVMMTAATKTFNIAGAHVGNVIIPDADLRGRFAPVMMGLGISPNSFGVEMVTAAYSPEGAAWVDALVGYLDGNRRIFDAAIAAIPGLTSMRLEGTYLSWVGFENTGLTPAEAQARVQQGARIAANHGASFGTGGEAFLRFNLATPRARVVEAADRLRAAFADLQ